MEKDMHNKPERFFRAAVITASDRCTAGEYADHSGQLICKKLEALGGEIAVYRVLPDDRKVLSEAMRSIADVDRMNLILTTGGTGLSSRDVTPEATMDIAEKMVPGIAEAIRVQSMKFTNRAMLSRGVACVRGPTLIINLPGSVKAVEECLSIILPVLTHALEMLNDQDSHSRPVG